MSGNMMLTVAALVLLTIFTLTANSVILESKSLDFESEYIITAIGLGQSVIDEAKNKAFDEAALGGSINSAADFTLKNSSTGKFVYDPGEAPVATKETSPDSSYKGLYKSLTAYDDVDDYNEYYRYVNPPRGGNYSINVRVDYVDTNNFDQISASKTYYKRMIVEVTSPYIKKPVYLKYVFSY